MNTNLRLGINIDHVATLRNARGGAHPCPVAAARLAAESGADGITAHLREDRRHVRDADIRRIRAEVALPLNFEMAATEEMLALAREIRPNACCLVPERREERTTEGGLDVVGQFEYLKDFCAKLKEADIRTSLFVAADSAQIEAAARAGADIVELHTGAYAHAPESAELQRLKEAAKLAHSLGLEVHAGHGLTFDNVGAIAEIPEVVELNIGHFIIGEAVFLGLPEVIRRMRGLMDEARR